MKFEKYKYYFDSIIELLIKTKDPIFIFREFTNIAPAYNKMLRLRSSDLCFQIRNKMDIWSIKETFLDRFYERFGVPIENGWTIIDIGAGIGEYTIFAAQLCPDSRIIAFEPYRESFELLKRNLDLNRINNVEIYSDAISGNDGSLFLEISGSDPLQFKSVDKINDNLNTDHQKINAISLLSAINRSGIETCDLLKLDCEGAEYDILLNTPPEVLNKIKRIVMEYHDGIVKYDHNILVEFLKAKGFSVRIQKNFAYDNLGYLCAIKL